MALEDYKQYTLSEVMKITKISYHALTYDIKTGKLAAYKRGSRYYVPEAALRDYINRMQAEYLGKDFNTIQLQVELLRLLEAGEQLVKQGQITQEELDKALEPKRQELKRIMEANNDKHEN